MTDPTMDLIRAANPYPGGMAPLPIDVVSKRLSQHGPVPSSRRIRLSVPDRRSVLVAGAVALTLAVVVLVTALHGRQTAGAGAHPTRSGSERTGVGAERGELIASLSVLRRPQTEADRHATLPSPFGPSGPLDRTGLSAKLRKELARFSARQRRRAGDPSLDRRLLRMITTSAGDEITVAPETWQPARNSPQRAEGLAVAIHTPGNQQEVDTGPTPVSVRSFRTHGLGIFNDTRRGAVLVPDGVARVELLGFGRVDRDPSITMDNATIAGKTAMVHDNLAAFTMSNLTATSPSGSAFIGDRAMVHMVWFNAAGQVIARPTTEFAELYITIRASSSTDIFQLGTSPLRRETATGEYASAAGQVSLAINGTGRRETLTLSARGLPRLPHDAYGVWLVNSGADDRFLGFISAQPRAGRLHAQVNLSPGIARRYRFVELTVEHSERPSRPGKVILRAPRP